MKAFNIWVTKRCNLRCRYCYEGTEKESVDFLEENIEYLYNFISSNSFGEEHLMISFHGGEPLLKFEIIKKICESLKQLSIPKYYSLTTNAMLLDEDILSDIKKYKISLSVSVDGNRYSHDMNRITYSGKGSYEIVVRNISKLIESRVRFRTRMTVSAELVGELYENVIHLVKLGCRNIVAVPDYLDVLWNEEKLQILSVQLQKIREYLKKNEDREISFIFLENEKPDRKGICAGGIEECSIDADMSVYPCTLAVGINELIIGNVKCGIDDERVKKLIKINRRENEACDGCGYKRYCISSRCKILNRMITGEYCEPSPLICGIENIIYRLSEDTKANLL